MGSSKQKQVACDNYKIWFVWCEAINQNRVQWRHELLREPVDHKTLKQRCVSTRNPRTNIRKRKKITVSSKQKQVACDNYKIWFAWCEAINQNRVQWRHELLR